MPDTAAVKIVHNALQWRRAYPKASALEILDQVIESALQNAWNPHGC